MPFKAYLKLCSVIFIVVASRLVILVLEFPLHFELVLITQLLVLPYLVKFSHQDLLRKVIMCYTALLFICSS